MESKSKAIKNGASPRGSEMGRWDWGTVLLPLACAALTSCGGGGDSGPPPPPPITVSVAPRVEAASSGSDIAVTNYQAFAPALAQTVLTGMQSGFVGADIGFGASPMSATALRQAARLLSPSTGREKALQASCGPPDGCIEQCSNGGTMKAIADGNNLSLIFSNCALDGTVVDGRVDDAFNNANTDADGSLLAADFNGTFTNLTEGTLATLNGPFRVVENECVEVPTPHCGHKRISFNDATATHGGQTVVLRLDILQEHGLTQTTEISGGLGVGGQFYALTPMAGERFVNPGAGGPPSAGRMWMQDAAGDTLEINSQSSILVDFSFYLNGSPTPSATWLGQPWSTFQ